MPAMDPSADRVRNVAVLLAGGVGVRIGLDIPKQLIKVAGQDHPRALAGRAPRTTRWSTRSS